MFKNEMQGEGESKAKMTAVGKVEMSVAVAELIVREEKKTQSNSHHQFQRRLPIKLRVNGLCIEATLLVRSKFLFFVNFFFTLINYMCLLALVSQTHFIST